jgi:hypothetical protein
VARVYTDTPRGQVWTNVPSMPRNNEIAVIGSSTAAKVYREDGTSKCFPNDGFGHWLRALTGQRVFLPQRNCFGVNGRLNSELLDDLPRILAATDAGLIIIVCGSNSIALDVPAVDAIRQMEAVRDMILRDGRKIIFLCDAPRGSTSYTGVAFTSARLAEFMAYRNWLLMQRYRQDCYVADAWADVADRTTTNSVLGYVRDDSTQEGIHPNKRGAYHIGRALAGIINTLYPPVPVLPESNADVYSASNRHGSLVPNPMFVGTTGTLAFGTGELASSWSNTGTAVGLTAVYSKVTSAITGAPMQQVALSGTSTGTTITLARQTPLSTNITPGDYLEAVGYFEIDSAHANIRGIGLQLQESAGEADLIFDGLQYDQTEVIDWLGAHQWIARTPVWPVSTNNLRLNIILQIPSGAAVAATIRFGLVALRKAQVV